jgi:hypothetical protein
LVSEQRYVMIVLNSDIPIVWNADNVDKNRDMFAFEGQIDAMFMDNSVSMSGGNFADLTRFAPRERFIVCYDNEPRSSETKKKILHAIENGFRVFIFPDNITYKDINIMVLNGYSPLHIKYLIEGNTFSGIEAKMRLEEWSKR